MALNRKLTPILSGRTISAVAQEEKIMSIVFDDGSVMKIETAEAGPGEEMTGRKVRAVRQKDDHMNLDFDDGSSVQIHLNEATSSVMLRDRQGVLEYAD